MSFYRGIELDVSPHAMSRGNASRFCIHAVIPGVKQVDDAELLELRIGDTPFCWEGCTWGIADSAAKAGKAAERLIDSMLDGSSHVPEVS